MKSLGDVCWWSCERYVVVDCFFVVFLRAMMDILYRQKKRNGQISQKKVRYLILRWLKANYAKCDRLR